MIINLKEFLKVKYPTFSPDRLEKEYKSYLAAGWTPTIKITK